MRERFFEAEKIDDEKSIQRDLEDAGIKDPIEWRKALDLETPLDGEELLKLEQRETKDGKIENKSWQRQLDTAFEQGNYSLIQALRRVRPESISNPEIIRNRLNELVVSRPSGWAEKIRKIRLEITIQTGIEADSAILREEFGKLLEQFGQEEGILKQLKEFQSAIQYAPSPEDVQQKYRSIFAGKKSYSFETEDLIKDIRDLTGIQPDKALFQEVVDKGDIRQAKKIAPLFGAEVTSEMIQQAYEAQFAKNGYLDTYRMAEIGESPNSALVEKAYQKIIEKHGERWIDSIKSLEQATGVKPVFTEEQLRPVFEEFLQNGWYGQKGYVGIEHVTELTGIKPSGDLIEKVAIKIVDEAHGYSDQGKAIKDGLDRLRESSGVDFTIPESEIQERYQKAITDKKAHVISNLYGALGIRPSVGKETARQFMVGFMDETYHNPISELEKVFGIKFEATDEEIEAKQNENLDKLRFDNLLKIKELTGKDTDKAKVRATLLGLLEKEALYPPHGRGDFVHWEKNIKQRFEQFGINPSQEEIVPIYERFIDNQTIYSDDLEKVHKLTGVPLPADLAQRAYQKILSPEYVSYGISESKTNYDYGRSSAVEIIFEVSGVRPELPTEKIQQYYRSQLESGLGGTREIQKIAEVTGIKPKFDAVDINQLYKQWILSGKEDYIRQVKEVTGIEPIFDEETLAHISRQIEDGIEKVRSGDYEKEDYRGKEFDTYQFKQDLAKVSSLTAATGVKLDIERLQSVYADILQRDPYFSTKIKQIVKATGVKPLFSPEQLQAKGQQLLEQGSLRSFEDLQEYGRFTFTPGVVAKTYDALLSTNRRYDEHDRKQSYNEDWVERIKRFKETTGIAPTETQLAAIFFHISQDGQIAGNRYGIERAIKFFTDNFETEITSGMVKDIVISYLAQGDVGRMGQFIEKVGVMLELTDEDIIPHTSRLLEAKDLNSLAYLKQEMKLARVPASETVVQSAYQYFASQEDFGGKSSKSLQAFEQVFELTGITANFQQEQVDQIYKSTSFAEWQKLNEVIGTLPSNEVVQYKYLQLFKGEHYVLHEAIRILTGQSPEAETISKALEHFAVEGKIEVMSKIVKIAGGKPDMNPESVQKAYRKITEQFNSSDPRYWGEKLVEAIDFLNDTLGISPDSETMYQIYSKTLGQTDYKNAYEGPDGKRIYSQFWEFLVKKFGKPDPEVVQRIYLAQLDA
ncbi:MAG: hypothetical protein Q7S48_01100 [bacterium]|nr:hypothetical protein [bacterium]